MVITEKVSKSKKCRNGAKDAEKKEEKKGKYIFAN